MIEFSGEISDKCKSYLIKHNALVALWGTLIPAIFLSVCFIIGYVLIDEFALWMFLLCEMFIVLVIVLAFLSPIIYRKKTFINMIPKIIRVNEDGSIDAEIGTACIHKVIDDIKQIIDFGDWYYIVFKFPKRVNLICQKDIMLAGNVNDFESIFSNKINRR
jgi:fumarate reductase subunit C